MPGMTALPGVIVIGMPALTLLLEAPAEIVLHLRVLSITRISRSTHNVADVVTCNHYTKPLFVQSTCSKPTRGNQEQKAREDAHSTEGLATPALLTSIKYICSCSASI